MFHTNSFKCVFFARAAPICSNCSPLSLESYFYINIFEMLLNRGHSYRDIQFCEAFVACQDGEHSSKFISKNTPLITQSKQIKWQNSKSDNKRNQPPNSNSSDWCWWSMLDTTLHCQHD